MLVQLFRWGGLIAVVAGAYIWESSWQWSSALIIGGLAALIGSNRHYVRRSDEGLPIHELLPIMVGEAVQALAHRPEMDPQAFGFLSAKLSTFREVAQRCTIPGQHREEAASQIRAKPAGIGESAIRISAT